MSLDQLNDTIATFGGSWIKLRTKADPKVDGVILSADAREKTFDGAVVTSRSTGKPRTEWVFTLQCEADPHDVDDDGVRKLSCNESMQRAIAKAVKESGKRMDEGGRLQLAVAVDPSGPREQAEYIAKYTPPTLPVGDADPFGETAAASPAAADPFAEDDAPF